MSNRSFKPLFLLLIIALSMAGPAKISPAAGPTTSGVFISPGEDHDRLVDALGGTDPAAADTALADIKAYLAKNRLSAGRIESALAILLDAKRYAELENLALAAILRDAIATPVVAVNEKFRAEAFLGAGDTASALSAAKAYYNVALLKDTADAIDTVALCLGAVTPDGPATAQRFRDQQVAWATTAPSSSNGDPVLAGIKGDPKPFDAAIARLSLISYKNFAIEGNLLLLADRTAEAEAVFKRAVSIAPAAKAGEACESVARAVRAASGCVAPANAYIASVQGGK